MNLVLLGAPGAGRELSPHVSSMSSASRTFPREICFAPPSRRAPSSASRRSPTWTPASLCPTRSSSVWSRSASRLTPGSASSLTAFRARRPRQLRSIPCFQPGPGARLRHCPRGGSRGAHRAHVAASHLPRLRLHRNSCRATCPKCGGEMYQRDDDNEETVRNRLAVYEKSTSPLIDYYRGQGLLKSVNGDQARETVYGDVKRLLVYDQD